MNTTPFTSDATLVALDSMVSRLEVIERQVRALEAERLQVLAEVFDLAAAAAAASGSGSGSGSAAAAAAAAAASGSGSAAAQSVGAPSVGVSFVEVTSQLIYRSMRAEIATALHLSEHTIDRRVAFAHHLTVNYPPVFDALRAGAIDLRHCAVITDAGEIIGQTDPPDVTARRAAYTQAVLPVAVESAPNRVKPIARRLAEQFAERTLDERYEVACARRRVWVMDHEDGMSDLVAHLPAMEAHAIWDRLTRISRHLTNAEPTGECQVLGFVEGVLVGFR